MKEVLTKTFRDVFVIRLDFHLSGALFDPGVLFLSLQHHFVTKKKSFGERKVDPPTMDSDYKN
jgi:hypothetical protein